MAPLRLGRPHVVRYADGAHAVGEGLLLLVVCSESEQRGGRAVRGKDARDGWDDDDFVEYPNRARCGALEQIEALRANRCHEP
jgi:hypothetical protein